MRTSTTWPILYLLATFSLKPSSADQPLWLLYSKLMENKELEQAKTSAATINTD